MVDIKKMKSAGICTIKVSLKNKAEFYLFYDFIKFMFDN